MKIENVKLLSIGDRFCYFIREREAVRLKKEAGKSTPWTDDTILQRFRFCNVRRMDDRVSRWLLDNWYKPHFGHPNMMVACAIARFFNLPASLEPITKYVFSKRWGAGTAKKIKEILRKRKSAGETVFNGAYIVSTNGVKMDKLDAVIDNYVAPLVYLKVSTDSMESCAMVLMESNGIGSFMAGQIVADMRWASPGQWADRDSWAPKGPGSLRGINRLAGRPLKTNIRQEQFLTELDNLREACLNKLATSITDRIEMHDWQNCLCEFDKYERTLFDEGRPKQLYQGQ